ncbi:L-serine ammonia-lyase, iron-sulfur-dependent subunit beta [soil metagenome]
MGVFEIIGPSMVGPSSSHTAGACRIGYAALRILDETPHHATIHLHGSFLATGAGHGTREALAAGLLGMAPDDERLIRALDLAAPDLTIEFQPIDLGPQAHPNSARLDLTGPTRSLFLTASSIGGGSVLLQEIDGQPVEIHGTLETLVLWHHDTPGFLARVTAVLACVQVNVATIRTSRSERGETAITSIEVDGQLPGEVSALLRKTPAITRLAVLAPLPGF